jgi:GntR family transcriptional regulator/MocR family aminotransferase
VKLMRLLNIPFRFCSVDGQGMTLDGIGAEKLAGVYVTPSHQFPLGCVLSAQRRARLVAMAREKDFFIIEDDYDSEYRYGGQTLTPLHALDPERVVYVGTFSKTLFPALRIGFAVVPAALRPVWTELRRYTDVQNAITEQATLSRFLEQGGMDRHIRAMTTLYGRKRGLVAEAVADVFGGGARILGDSAGLHLALRIPGRRFGREFRERCRARGVSVMPCSRYVFDENGEYDDTLLLGYGNVQEDSIREGVRLLLQSCP